MQPPLRPARAHRSLIRRLRRRAISTALFGAWLCILFVVLQARLPQWIAWAAFAAGLVAIGARAYVRGRRFARENSLAMARLDENDLVGAADRFAALHVAFGNDEPLGATATFNLAIVEMRLGALARATELLESVERDRAKESVAGIHRLSSAHLAFVHVLAGDLALAREWLAEARRRASADSDGVAVGGLHGMTEGALELRSSGPAAGARTLAERWREIEAHATVEFARGARVLRAFALEGTGAPRAEVERELAFVREAVPGSLAYLGTAWPELNAFLAREGLSSAER